MHHIPVLADLFILAASDLSTLLCVHSFVCLQTCSGVAYITHSCTYLIVIRLADWLKHVTLSLRHCAYFA